MELESIRFFVKVIEQKSFTKAAGILNVPKSTISKSISRMEGELGTSLIQRTTRSLSLTAAGKQFFDYCQSAIHQLEDAQKTMFGADKVVAGPIRLTAPEDLGTFMIARAVGELTKQHPKISFELNYTDQVVDLVKDGYDLAVRIGPLNQSNFKAKKVGEIILIMVASPKYIKTHPKINHPRDLEQHECLSYRARSLSQRWTLHSKSTRFSASIKSRITSNQMTSLMQISQSDVGIALVPAYLCQPLLVSGDLIHVLPEWSSPGLPVYLLSPNSNLISARIRITADHLATKIKNALHAPK